MLAHPHACQIRLLSCLDAGDSPGQAGKVSFGQAHVGSTYCTWVDGAWTGHGTRRRLLPPESASMNCTGVCAPLLWFWLTQDLNPLPPMNEFDAQTLRRSDVRTFQRSAVSPVGWLGWVGVPALLTGAVGPRAPSRKPQAETETQRHSVRRPRPLWPQETAPRAARARRDRSPDCAPPPASDVVDLRRI